MLGSRIEGRGFRTTSSHNCEAVPRSKAHRLLYHPTLGSRVTKKKMKVAGLGRAGYCVFRFEGRGLRGWAAACKVTAVILHGVGLDTKRFGAVGEGRPAVQDPGAPPA